MWEISHASDLYGLTSGPLLLLQLLEQQVIVFLVQTDSSANLHDWINFYNKNLMTLLAYNMIWWGRILIYKQDPRPSHLTAEDWSPMNTFLTSLLLNQAVTPYRLNHHKWMMFSVVFTLSYIANKNTCDCFPDSVELPSLAEAESLESDWPLTLNELKEAALDLRCGKSPGLGGFPRDFNFIFWRAWVPYWTICYETLWIKALYFFPGMWMWRL